MKGLHRLYFGCSGKTLVIGKNEVKHWVHGRVRGPQVSSVQVIGKSEVKYWVHGRVGGPRVLSVKVSHRISGDLDLVVGVYSGVPLQAR